MTTPSSYASRSRNPAGFEVFTGRNGMIIPEHIFRDTMGPDSRNAGANLTPVGGPFVVREFLARRYRPLRSLRRLLGGRQAVLRRGRGQRRRRRARSARAVLQTDEADFAWGAGGDPKVLAELEKAGGGIIVRNGGITGDRVCFQFADPNSDVNGARAEPTTQHPLFQHRDLREAVSLVVPRDVLADEVYGNGAVPTVEQPGGSDQVRLAEHDLGDSLERAKEIVAGYPEVEGYESLFQTSITSTRQNAQAVIKAGLEELGFSVELRESRSMRLSSSRPTSATRTPTLSSTPTSKTSPTRRTASTRSTT